MLAPPLCAKSDRDNSSGGNSSKTTLVFAGLWLQRPEPPLASSALVNGGTTLAATRDGVELSEAGGSFGLRYGRDVKEINYAADAKGGMGARYVDSRTGYVTVVSMNVE